MKHFIAIAVMFAATWTGAQTLFTHNTNGTPGDTNIALSGLSLSGNPLTLSTSNNGTVTSVGVSMPAGYSVASSPVTSSGTIAVSYETYGLPFTNLDFSLKAAYQIATNASTTYYPSNFSGDASYRFDVLTTNTGATISFIAPAGYHFCWTGSNANPTPPNNSFNTWYFTSFQGSTNIMVDTSFNRQ